MDFPKQRQIMVDSQIRVNDVTDPDIIAAFLNTPREAFVPKSLQASAYAEHELKTSDTRALWTPRDLSKLLLALEPKASDISLIIGAGAGYSTALLSEITDTALGLEDSAEAVEAMSERFDQLGLDSAVAVEGALDKGLSDQGPFDVIFVAGMTETVPQTWLDQLNDGGRMAITVRKSPALGSVRIYTRAGDTFSYREAFEACPPVLPGFEAAKTFVF